MLLFKYKPYRTIKDTWASYECSGVEMENEVFPSIKWEDEPVEVNIFTNEFIQEFGDACYKQGEQDACRFEYGEYPEGNLTIKEYVASKNKTI